MNIKANNAWAKYLTWNDAVADVIYPPSDDALPAYMDMETAELLRIAEQAGYTGGEPHEGLIDAVRAVTVDSIGQVDLQPLVRQTGSWSRKKERKVPPPSLAFLAVTALAAEAMGNTDDDIANNAYYARLAKLLGRPVDDQRLRHQYSAHAEFLWRCLNSWLEGLDGERGIPTAYALTWRYVGLPMSQALVREGDRQKLPAMFAQFGLSPGMQIAPEDLTGYLDHWLSSDSSPASAALKRLWGRQATHERIATVAAVELANWDGTIEDGSVLSIGGTTLATKAMVIANLRYGFMDSSLELSLGLRPLTSDMNGEMQVRSTTGSWLDIGFSPGTAGLWRIAYNQAVDFGSMLEGAVLIRHSGGDATEYKRFPRTVIPLVYDELQSAFVESERLQIGADSILLVRTVAAETKVKTSVVDEVERVLNAAARPGFQRIDSLNGLPQGWALFKDVQLFGAPTTHLNELVPLARNKLTIAGGLRIPSKIRKWSSLSPPEVRAAVQSEPHLKVTLAESATDEVLFQWQSETGVLVARLVDAGLGDGDYRVSLYTGTKSNPIQQSSIKLRSSLETDTMWEFAPRLTYSLETPLGVLSASELDKDASTFVDGLVSDGDADVEPTVKATAKVSWSGSKQVIKPSLIQIGTPDPKSCIVTGAHHIILPTYYGKTAAKFVDGECKSCGMVKRFPAWPKYKWNTKRVNASDEFISVHELEAVDEHTHPNWNAALDALMHLGGGTMSSLQSIALQLEGSLVFVDTFVKTLESLGHIAVERDDQFRVTRWEISPSCIAETTTASYRFAGFWPQAFVDGVSEQVDKLEANLAVDTERDGPSTYEISNVDRVDALTLNAAEPSIAIVTDAGALMMRALPRLSTVGEALPRISMPGYQSAERFDMSTASWVATGDPFVPGAYRLRRGFESMYVFRSEDDVSAKTAALAPVHLVKHLAANDAKKTLVAYQKKSDTIFVPRGSDLPGLYGRALVAMSGHAPSGGKVSLNDGPKRHCVLYKNVERESADLLVTLLTT